MMPIKLAGAVCVILSFAYAGYLLGSYEALESAQAEAFLNLLRHIRLQISCYKTPISEIISAYDDKELKECGFLSNFDTSWNRALAAAPKLRIDAKTKKLLESFGEELGGSYKDEQIACCDYYIEKLDAHVEFLKQELPKKQKLIKSFALILGILAVIIFI